MKEVIIGAAIVILIVAGFLLWVIYRKPFKIVHAIPINDNWGYRVYNTDIKDYYTDIMPKKNAELVCMELNTNRRVKAIQNLKKILGWKRYNLRRI